MWLFISKVNCWSAAIDIARGLSLLFSLALAFCWGFTAICFHLCPSHPPVRAKIGKYKFHCEDSVTGGRGKFPFRKRSLPFETVDAIYNGRLHTSLQRKLKEQTKKKY